MAEEVAVSEIEITNSDLVNSAPDNMDLTVDSEANGEPNGKRVRDEGDNEPDAASKKQKVEKSVEEDRLEGLEGEGDGEEEAGGEKELVTGPVSLGPKEFGSSVEMFDYFFKLLHHWPTDLDINKYEEMVLMDLLKKGHAEPDQKIGVGILAFQVRVHPTWKSRCFFLIREDNSFDDFSFRKCVDRILPLPDDIKVKPDSNKALRGGGGGKWRGGGGRGGGRGGGGRGRGRGGRR